MVFSGIVWVVFTSAIPATSRPSVSGNRRQKVRIAMPPMLCPTSTGRSSPTAAMKLPSVAARASMVTSGSGTEPP